jgi:hypothetical protein
VGYGPAYWSRLKNESPLFQERIEAYRQFEEQAWRSARIVNYNAIGDHLEERFWQKVRRRKRHMSHTRALIRSATDLFRESDALQPLAAVANLPDEPRAASTRARPWEAEPPPELKAERAPVSVPVSKNYQVSVVAELEAKIAKARAELGWEKGRLRVQDANGMSGRRRF